MHFVLDHMHTKISIDIPDYKDINIKDELCNLFNNIEQRFSSFLLNSEVSKYANGQIALNSTSQELRQIITLCKTYETKTNGYFSPYFNNKFDPTGLVKGWAIKQAEYVFKDKNIDIFMINAGGDIICRSNGMKKWNIAITNPANTKNTIANISCEDLAIATSGLYERKGHIVNPKKEKHLLNLQSVSVLSKSIIEADVYATALFAMGKKAISYAKNNNIKAIIIDSRGLITQT